MKRLLSLTGPLDLRAMMAARELVSLPPAYLLNLAALTDEQLCTALYGVIWTLRGRNGLLKNGETD